jgi:hypothetical protein
VFGLLPLRMFRFLPRPVNLNEAKPVNSPSKEQKGNLNLLA